jgi:hypothetical protein
VADGAYPCEGGQLGPPETTETKEVHHEAFPDPHRPLLRCLQHRLLGSQRLTLNTYQAYQIASLSQTFDLDVQSVLSFQRNSSTTGSITVRATNGVTRTIRVNNGNGSPWVWANTALSHNAELTLDLFEAAANNPGAFRLKLRKVRIWYLSSRSTTSPTTRRK